MERTGRMWLVGALLAALAAPAWAQDQTDMMAPAIGEADSGSAPDPRAHRLEEARRRAAERREHAAEEARRRRQQRSERRKDLEDRSREEAAARRAERASQRPRAMPELGRVGPEQILAHLIHLEERILETQGQMLATLSDTLASLENGSTQDRKVAVRRAIGFNVRLRHMERQIPRLERALERFRGELPGSAMAELELRRELIMRNLRQISEEHERVVEAYKERKGEDEELDEELEMLEEETPPEDLELPEGPGDEPAPSPDTTEEAAALLEVGEVQTPGHLTELFERVPEDDTPRGSLRRYRDYVR